MDEYRFVGVHADDLDGGRTIAPGEFTGEIDVGEDSPKNKALLDDGLLIPVPSGSTKKALDEQDRAENARISQAQADQETPEAVQSVAAAPSPVPTPRTGDVPKDGEDR